MIFSKDSVANLIYDLIKYEKVCQKDLEFALDVFKTSEQYEKCSIIKELLDLKYYDNRKRNNNESILDVENIVKAISSGSIFMDKKNFLKQKTRIRKLKDDIEEFYNMMEHSKIVIPPFKNKNNLKYFIKK